MDLSQRQSSIPRCGPQYARYVDSHIVGYAYRDPATLYREKQECPTSDRLDERDNDYELDDNPSNADSPDPGSHMMNCISEFARCCSRWHTIKFDMPKSDYGVPLLGALTLYRLIAVFFRDIHLPRLASFSLFHHGYIPYPSDEPGSRAKFIDTIHFYRSWTAPSLRAISFSGIVPVPIPGASIQELSLNLQVEFNGVFPDFFVMFRDLLTFLHETPSLQTLKICSSSGETSDSDQIRDFSNSHSRKFTRSIFHDRLRFDTRTWGVRVQLIYRLSSSSQSLNTRCQALFDTRFFQ